MRYTQKHKNKSVKNTFSQHCTYCVFFNRIKKKNNVIALFILKKLNTVIVMYEIIQLKVFFVFFYNIKH